MKITTMTNKVFDTDTMPDVKAQLIESIEKNEFTELAKKHNFSYFMYVGMDNESWVKFNFPSAKETEIFFSCLNDWLLKRTDNKLRMVVIENDENPPEESEMPEAEPPKE